MHLILVLDVSKLRQAFAERLEIGVCLQEAAVKVHLKHVTG
jgi:hypothetical protein